MANKKWRGDVPGRKQVVTLTVGGTVEAGDKFIVTCNGKSISTSATTTSTSTTATEIQTALAASTIAEFAEITWTVNSSVVTGTAKTAGVPCTVTVSTTESNDAAADAQTFVLATATTNTGPNNWDNADNWSPSGVPASSDDVHIENSAVDILYGLDQNAVTLTSLNIPASYTGKIGLPENEGDYIEYRDQYLKISATTVNIGAGPGNGSGRIKLNTGSVQTTLNVFNTAQPVESGNDSVIFKGTHASNVVNITKGTVGIGAVAGDTATVATLRVGYVTNVSGDAKVRCGSGVTLTTIEKSGGDLTLNSNVTTVNQTDGNLTANGSMTATTINLDGGNLYWQSTGTITTLNVGSDAKADFSRDMRARTVSACNIFAGATVNDPFKTVTWTAGIDIERASLEEVTIQIGTHHRITPGAVA